MSYSVRDIRECNVDAKQMIYYCTIVGVSMLIRFKLKQLNQFCLFFVMLYCSCMFTYGNCNSDTEKSPGVVRHRIGYIFKTFDKSQCHVELTTFPFAKIRVLLNAMVIIRTAS